MLEVAIQKRYNSFTLDVEFCAADGVTALLGASGCGKSLTLKCVAGVVQPDSGRIVLNGRVLFDSSRGINLPPQARRVGFLFQNYALFPHMTVRQNIAAALRGRPLPGQNRAAREERVEQSISKFCLAGLEHKYPGQLSGGQQQRAALARLAAGEPELIMLDEPFTALDQYLRWQMEQEIMDLLDAHHGNALFVSHDRDEVYRLCDQIALLDQGRVDLFCAKEQMFESPKSVAAAKLTGCKNISRARRLDTSLIEAIDWGCTLSTAMDVPPELSHVGCRAHCIEFAQTQAENRLRCIVERLVEDSFSIILLLRREQAEQSGPPLRWELPKEAWRQIDNGSGRVEIHLPPQKLLLLGGTGQLTKDISIS